MAYLLKLFGYEHIVQVVLITFFKVVLKLSLFMLLVSLLEGSLLLCDQSLGCMALLKNHSADVSGMSVLVTVSHHVNLL